MADGWMSTSLLWVESDHCATITLLLLPHVQVDAKRILYFVLAAAGALGRLFGCVVHHFFDQQ